MLTCSEAPKFHLDKHRRRTSMCGHTPFCATVWVREHVISSAGCERESPVLSSLPGTEGRVAWGLEIRASAWTGTGIGPERWTEIHHLCSLAQDPRVLNSTVVRCLIQLFAKELLHKQHPNHSLFNDSHRQPYGASPGAGKRLETDAKTLERDKQAQASIWCTGKI